MQLSICNCVFMISGINLVKPINSVAIFLNYQFSLVLMKKYKACPKNTKHKQWWIQNLSKKYKAYTTWIKGGVMAPNIARRRDYYRRAKVINATHNNSSRKFCATNKPRRHIFATNICASRMEFCATIIITSSRKYILGHIIVYTHIYISNWQSK